MSLLKPPDNKFNVHSHSQWSPAGPTALGPALPPPPAVSPPPPSPPPPPQSSLAALQQLQQPHQRSLQSIAQPQTVTRRLSLVGAAGAAGAAGTAGGRRDSGSGGSPSLRRVCSWKLSRPSLRRKSRRHSGSEPEDADDVPLNNSGTLSVSYGLGHSLGADHSSCNGRLLASIRNDTQGLNNNNAHTPNNNAGSAAGSRRPSLSPQNSLRGRSHSQVSWVGSGSGRSLATSPSSQQPPPSPGPHLPQPPQHLAPLSVRIPSDPDLLATSPLASVAAGSGGASGHSPARPYLSSSRRSHSLQYEELSASARAHANVVNQLLLAEGYDSHGDVMMDPLAPLSTRSLSLGSSILQQQLKELQHMQAHALDITEEGECAGSSPPPSDIRSKKIFYFFEPTGCFQEREDFSLWLFPPENRFRRMCSGLVQKSWFDNLVLFFIGLNCITLAMERPNIPPDSRERLFLATANYVFTAVFAVEMVVKVIATSMLYGEDAYFTSGWNVMDGSLVIISIVDLLMSLISASSPRIFGILRVFRLLRSLRPLRVINRAPGLKLVVQTLLSSLRPIGNIVLICCTFFIIFGILGVQLFKGAFYYCDGPDIKNVRNKTDCLADERNHWVNRKYNFDDLSKALMSLFVLSSRDGWVNIMYTGLDAVGVDQQPIENFSEWRLLYFISFILLVGFFVLNMFVGVVVENFHRCREEQEKEERVRRLAKRAKQMEKKRRRMHEPPYYTNYSKARLLVHNVVTSKYFDLAIAAVIGLNVVTMAMEFYMMPKALTYALKIFNYFFTAVFILESTMKLVALGFKIYLKDRWNQLDVGIVILSVIGIVLEELESKIIPINPTIIRVMRVLRIARVLKLLKMAKGIRALLDTVMQALPQVGNLGLLFFLLFFIFAALGVELFGRLDCSEEHPCQGLGEHAHFANFGMAFLTLFRVATGDNWNGIMKDTLRDDCDNHVDCVRNCCVSPVIAPIFFVIFVLMAQFVLVNVVVAVLMKHLEESHKQMEDEMDMEVELERELERELAAEQEELLEEVQERMMQAAAAAQAHRPLAKVYSLPANFTFTSLCANEKGPAEAAAPQSKWRRPSMAGKKTSIRGSGKRRQTLHAPRGALTPSALAAVLAAVPATAAASVPASSSPAAPAAPAAGPPASKTPAAAPGPATSAPQRVDSVAAVRALSTDDEESTSSRPGVGPDVGEELMLITAAQRHRALLRTLHVSSEDIAAADEDADDETSLVAPTSRTDDFCDTSDSSRPSHHPLSSTSPPSPTLSPSTASALMTPSRNLPPAPPRPSPPCPDPT